jgi:DNA repair exonuclease SbcCD ATPase subunit
VIEFKSLDISNVLSYKKAKVEFDGTIKRVYGINKDATDNNGVTGNGVGKSLLFSTISNVLFFHTPVALTSGRGSKEILSKKSRISLALDDFTIKQTEEKFVLFDKGVNLKTRTIPLAKTKIRQWFPLSEEEFFTTTYVSSSKPYLLQQSTNLKRLDILSRLFQLNDYEKLKDAFAKKLRLIKDDEIKAGVYEQVLKDKLDTLNSLPKLDKNKFGELSSLMIELKAKNLDLQKGLQKTESQLALLEGVQQLDAKLIEFKKKYKYKEKPAVVEKRLIKEEKLQKRYADYLSDFNHYSSKLSNIKTKLESHEDIDFDSSVIKLKIAKENQKVLEEKAYELKSLKREYNNYESTLSTLLETLKEDFGFVSVQSVPQEDVEDELSVCNTTLKLEKLLHNHNKGDTKCPTCNSKFERKHVEKSLKIAKARSEVLTNILSAQKLIKKIPKKVIFDADAEAKIQRHLKKSTKIVEDLENQVSVAKTVRRLTNELEEVRNTKPAKIENPNIEGDASKELSFVRRILDLLESKAALLKKTTLSETSTIKDVEKELFKLKHAKEVFEKEHKLLLPELDETASSLETYAVNRRSRSQLKIDVDRTKSELDKLLPSIKTKHIYTALVKTYSSKGLKVAHLQNLCALIENNLNHYSSLVYSENFKFKIVVSEKGVSIQVTRQSGKVSDARNLSGAESNCFTLLCILSILPILPDNRRTNLIVLDEPLCNSDAATRIRVIQNYFPVLHSVVSNIVFISNTPEEVPGSKPLTIIKSDGTSTLVNEKLT